MKASILLFTVSLPLLAGTWVHNGDFVTTDKFENVVALTKNKNIFCSAALIHPKLVLTAAHCLQAIAKNHELGVYVGTGYTQDDRVYSRKNYKNARTYKVKEYFTYSKGSWAVDLYPKAYDIGLIVLDEEIVNVTPLKIIKSQQEFDSLDLKSPLIVGHGTNNEGKTGLQKFGMGKFYKSNEDENEISLRKTDGPDFSNHLPGDSGAPLIYENSEGSMVTPGVLHGSIKDYDLGERIITYTMTHKYLCWIEKKGNVSLDHQFNCENPNEQMDSSYEGSHKIAQKP